MRHAYIYVCVQGVSYRGVRRIRPLAGSDGSGVAVQLHPEGESALARAPAKL